ncbi:MAG: low temperature requirement protein A [Solirubrobacterales bacterium]|nr:low temperature requirement protein A [Solirubrobacterales bacterium]
MGATREAAAEPGQGPATEGVAELEQERRTTPVELLWDLVFAFALTQVTTLLSKELSWAGFGRSMLVLALVWWAWSAFVWAANAQSESSPVLLAVLLAATACIFIAGIALPRAFAGEATLFAAAYAAVRLLHLLLYADASRRGNAAWSAIAGFAWSVVLGIALLVAGSFLPEGPRLALWGTAAAIDYAGPGWLTRGRLRGLQRVAVAHFAERYGLFVIIALGESIIAVGVRTRTAQMDARLIVTVMLCLLITFGLWWTYFTRFAQQAEAGLRAAREPVLAASDAYSYLHLVIVAGIVVFAVGARLAVGGSLGEAGRLALCGGVALYLVGLDAAAWRLLGSIDLFKLAAALVLLAVGLFVPTVAPWVAAAIVTGVLAVVSLVDVPGKLSRDDRR